MTISTATDPTVARVTYPAHLVDPPRSGRLRRSDIIVILLDAARADVFSAGTLPTPGTDELAAEGTRFEHARAAAPWTGQSVPSLLTGRFPGSIGALTWGSPIPVEALTLPELLRESGYHTVVWSQHNLYGGNQTVRRGFERFTEVRSDVLADRNLLPEATDLFVDRRPTFALIHLLPPHGPYEPPAPFAGAYTDWYTGDFPVDAPALNSAARADRRQPTDDDLRYVRSRYDENVVFADALVERLLRVLREAERYNDALVVLTSDHGEGFFEHGYFLHTRLLYDEFLRIPLVIKWPQTSVEFAPVVDANVNLVDVVPTLVDGLGLTHDLEGFQGRTLLPLVFDDEPLNRTLFAETRGVARSDVAPRPSEALVAGQYKVIRDEITGEFELYDLAADPGEQDDVSDCEPFWSRYLLQSLRLQRHRNLLAASEHAQQPEQQLDAESIQRLRALGYLR